MSGTSSDPILVDDHDPTIPSPPPAPMFPALRIVTEEEEDELDRLLVAQWRSTRDDHVYQYLTPRTSPVHGDKSME